MMTDEVDSKMAVSFLYEHRDGDYVQALHMWYKLRAADGGTAGAVQRDEFTIWVTSDQLAEAINTGTGMETEKQMIDHGSLRDSHETTAPFHTPGAES
jgi:hypothetical protein